MPILSGLWFLPLKVQKNKRMKTLTVSKAKKKADLAVSMYVRKSAETKLGVECYTCGKYFPVKNIQCGHFIPRSFNTTRFNLMNLHPQCVGCNVFKKGDLITYREHLVRDYGEEKVKLLEEMRHKLKQFKVYELDEIYQKYKAKIKEY